MREFFGITESYRFEWNDLRALIQVLNIILIMMFGLEVSWFGLAIAVFGLCKDFAQHRHINDMILHLSGIALNIYFLSLLYGG